MTPDDKSELDVPGPHRWTRRRVLAVGLGGAAALVLAGAAGVEFVSHGVLPGKQELEQLDGACSVAGPSTRFAGGGRSLSGSFFSRARRRQVGYTIAWPPGAEAGTPLPLVVMLHGYGANHTNALTGMSPAEAVALVVDGQPLPPMALVTVDGGGDYWNPHPRDDPMAMVVSELIPLCQRTNLGRSPQKIGTMGISMGGYGALLLAERYPSLIRAVAAISPAIWTSYEQAQAANPGGARVRSRLRRGRCGHALRSTCRDPGPGRLGQRRPVPSRSGHSRTEAPGIGRVGVVTGLSHGSLLHRPGAAFAAIPRAASDVGLTVTPVALYRLPHGRPRRHLFEGGVRPTVEPGPQCQGDRRLGSRRRSLDLQRTTGPSSG